MPKYVLAGVQAAYTTATALGCGKYDCEPRVWQAVGKLLANRWQRLAAAGAWCEKRELPFGSSPDMLLAVISPLFF